MVYKSGMDRRTLRAEARRAAFEDASTALIKVRSEPRGDWRSDAASVALYLQTRNALVRWLHGRSKGVMGPPPGGVGTR